MLDCYYRVQMKIVVAVAVVVAGASFQNRVLESKPTVSVLVEGSCKEPGSCSCHSGLSVGA